MIAVAPTPDAEVFAADDSNSGPISLIEPPTIQEPFNASEDAIDRFLAGSPLAGMGAAFIEAATAYGIDPRLMPAVALWESSLGRLGCVTETRNPFGLKDALNPAVTCRTFPSYADAIYAATATFGSYPVDIAMGLCWWVRGPNAACDYDYVGRVLAAMEGIR